jgi:hypothetical protein
VVVKRHRHYYHTSYPPWRSCVSADINDFSSKEAMEANGWQFSWDNVWTFLDVTTSGFCIDLPATSWCGFDNPDNAEINLTLSGRGEARVDFAGPWGGSVYLYVNEVQVDSMSGIQLSKNYTFM